MEDEEYVSPGYPRKQMIKTAIWRPAADVFETIEAYVIKMDLPGLSHGEVVVEAQGNELVIVGHSAPDPERELAKYHLLERGHGQFARKIILPDGLNIDQARANLVKGVLTVVLPKKEQELPALRIELHVID